MAALIRRTAAESKGGLGLMLGTELTENEFAKFRALIYKLSGIQISESKLVMVTNRLRRRLRATGIKGFSEYHSFLTSPAGNVEMQPFLNEITTNETYFYRDVHHYDWLNDAYFPEVLKEARLGLRPRRLRVWSAASSTGEELYSILMKFQPWKSQFNGWKLDFLGTDLSKAALDAAALGVYDDRAVRNVPLAERSRYFDHDPKSQRWTVKDEIRNAARWKSHNLLNPINEDSFDCVFIKNVLIYFDTASKLVATKHLIGSLAKGGSLVIGPTEGIYTMLAPLEKLTAWHYRKPD